MRLFVAIDFQELSEAFRTIQKQLDAENISLKLTDTFHLTLKFLGEVEDTTAKDIENCLSSVRFEPFKAELGNLGVFPGQSYIKVIWIGVEPADRFISLQKEIEKSFENHPALFFKKENKFSPHITLARVKFVKDKARAIRNIKGISIDSIKPESKECTVSKFHFIKSTLARQGPIYETLFSFPKRN